MAPEARRSRIVFEMNGENGLHDGEFVNSFAGGTSEEKDSPLKSPLKGRKKSWTLTLFCIQSRTMGVSW